jgi:hypothetical protein
MTLEILSIRFLNLAPGNYIAEVATDGVRIRRKGTSRWMGPASWESIISAAARTSNRQREGEPVREMGVGA